MPNGHVGQTLSLLAAGVTPPRFQAVRTPVQKMLGMTGAAVVVVTEIVQRQQAGAGCISDLRP